MQIPASIRRILPSAAAVLTGLLLFASFPPLEMKDLAWIALVPIFLSARQLAPVRAWRLGYVAGFLFWVISISWIRYVSYPGWILLALYCALYVAPAAMLFAWWAGRWGIGSWHRNLALMLLLSITWAGWEYVRSVLFTGFAWNPIAATQYRNVLLLQSARWGGVYPASAMIVLVNAGIALTILQYAERREGSRLRAHPELMFAFLVVAMAVADSWKAIRAASMVETRPLSVALIQPRVPQMWYYQADRFETIRAQMNELTANAQRVVKPDLVIWPETSIPDELRNSLESYDLVYGLVTNGSPILVGSMDTEWTDAGPRFYNTSFLVDTNGIISGQYDKRHLVIFGEYVPLRDIFPFLKMVTPIQESFSAGATSTVFRLENPPVPLSVLICFEDTVASLSRDSVCNGARLLVNQTNDGWFDPDAAPKQHMIQCVFRCIENRVPALRAANTGVSCSIDRYGRIREVLDDGAGNTFVSGFRAASADVPVDDMPFTFYTIHGDVFGQVCAAAAVALLVLMIVFRRRRIDPGADD